MLPHAMIVCSIHSLDDKIQHEKAVRYRSAKKPTDLKIKQLVLNRIDQYLRGRDGALFPSEIPLRIDLNFLVAGHFPISRKKSIDLLLNKRRSPRYPSSLQKGPIGLRQCESCMWINSMMQFLIFLPGTLELFSLLPKSFQPVRTFVDQYLFDQMENRRVSLADSAELIEWLLYKLSFQYSVGAFDIYELLIRFMKLFFPVCPFAAPSGIHPVVLHAEWHLVAEALRLEESLQKKMQESPPELLIGCKGLSVPLKSHYFLSSVETCYDLDSFIEARPDGKYQEHYITYLKIGGEWFQCDDDRIVSLRATCLGAPLLRAVLLHYKKSELRTNRNYLCHMS